MSKMSFTAVGDMLIQRRISHEYPGFNDIRSYISRGDVKFFNLETTLHHGEFFGNQFYGGSYLHADPKVLEDAAALGFNMLSFANNHTFDFSYGGLTATLNEIQKYPFVHSGVGMNLDEASSPGYLETPNGRVALISVVSTMMNPAAMAGRQSRRIPGRPGVNGLRIDDKLMVTEEEFSVLKSIVERSNINAKEDISRAEGYTPALPPDVLPMKDIRIVLGDKTKYCTSPNSDDMKRVVRAIYEAQAQADYIIVSIHSHEVSGTSKEIPADFLVEFSHRCIDCGAHAIIGHGPHLLRPIEIYHNRPIFYSLGNFILHNELIESAPEDMYEKYNLTSDSTLRDMFYTRSKGYTRGLLSDKRMLEAVIPYFEMENGQLVNLELLPIELGVNEPRWRMGNPKPSNDLSIMERLSKISVPYGTKIKRDEETGIYKVEI